MYQAGELAHVGDVKAKMVEWMQMFLVLVMVVRNSKNLDAKNAIGQL